MAINKNDQIKKIIALALAEDVQSGDITSKATIRTGSRGKARMVCKAGGVVAGTAVARSVFKAVDPKLQVKVLVKDGSKVKKGTVLMEIAGPVRSLLTAERTALNFVQRLSGVATQTARYVAAVKGANAAVLDTRKTTPGMRLLEKDAVKAGGGTNHRTGLWDMFLVKDNHNDDAGGIAAALDRVKAYRKRTGSKAKVEVETRSLPEVEIALAGKPDRIMLDNMTPVVMKKAVALIRRVAPRTEIEASGNVTLKNIRKVAETGVDYISVGALTHSVPALDISLQIKT